MSENKLRNPEKGYGTKKQYACSICKHRGSEECDVCEHDEVYGEFPSHWEKSRAYTRKKEWKDAFKQFAEELLFVLVVSIVITTIALLVS